jgi:DNA-binding transcriptional ArsR family regulator
MDDRQAAGVAKELGHPLRIAILRSIRERRAVSPSEYSRQFDEPPDNVSYNVKALTQAGVVEVAETVQRRGAMEHSYRLRQPRAKLLFRLMDLLAKAAD